ncbi:hypothetical protein LMG8520_2613 [Lactococcus lactis subsp. lactis]|uniref:Uncharacterized protein n=2 Tax=Lactococcus lactis TaxID=1358 RepID=A0A2A5SDN8_LACLH|nr:hypothetical protein Llab_2160 [Lactococcus lactis]KST93074.1 hypothetical protein LKF67_1009 [Lactococcus lactis subsp. lactis]PCS11589.1 hypothetical protein RU90_GL000701 [Lactococcus lactis subsp. hordniae]KST93160.1 hypothetical protein KF134_0027 [Lactococcus lactis subsp. lactis]KST97003.1 hypothetical protein KF146_0769 [Lactococcus lactis subsp. lactis]
MISSKFSADNSVSNIFSYKRTDRTVSKYLSCLYFTFIVWK